MPNSARTAGKYQRPASAAPVLSSNATLRVDGGRISAPRIDRARTFSKCGTPRGTAGEYQRPASTAPDLSSNAEHRADVGRISAPRVGGARSFIECGTPRGRREKISPPCVVGAKKKPLIAANILKNLSAAHPRRNVDQLRFGRQRGRWRRLDGRWRQSNRRSVKDFQHRRINQSIPNRRRLKNF